MPSFTIANGASLSNARLINADIVGVEMPADWTAADLSFETSAASDGTFVPVYDVAGDLVAVTCDADRYVAILPADVAWAKGRYLKLRSVAVGTATPANQGAERVIGLDVGSLS